MSTPARLDVRPNRLAWIAGGIMTVAVLGGVIAIWATARAAQIEPARPREVPVAVPEAQAEPTMDPRWVLAGEAVAQMTTIERTGYRQGLRHVFEVVRLEPSGVEVEVHTARGFLAMRAAAADAGVDLRLVSGFRTAAQQRALFRAWRKGRGNKAARPGQSNHQSGRALDIAVMRPGTFAWLEANAALFGFQRTVKNEPWHWEYVESPIARGEMKQVSRKAKKSTKASKAAKATKLAKASKASKATKTIGHARRPTLRPSSVNAASASSRQRVASSQR